VPEALDESALTPPERLAVAYAPRAFQPLWQGFLTLDRRLADAAREGRDPLMIQLRLAWWRDRFDGPASTWPAGEPLLALLQPWDRERAALRAMVDGWEARIVGEDGGAALGKAQIEAVLALARLCQIQPDETVRRAAAEWLGLQEPGPRAPILPSALRPLAILRGMALRETSGKPPSPLRDYLAILRIGTFGR
jgi:15-cis-phytoene synthase